MTSGPPSQGGPLNMTGTAGIRLAWSLPDRPAHAVGTGTKVPLQHGERP